MKKKFMMLSLLVIISVIVVSGCAQNAFFDTSIKKQQTAITQEKYSQCHNYLISETDYVAQSFTSNFSILSSIYLRVATTDDVEIVLSILEGNVSGREVFSIKKKVTVSDNTRIKINTPDVQVKKNETYYLKLMCPECIHRLSIPESYEKPESKMVCFWYATDNPFPNGRYSYKSVELESKDPHLDLTFKVEGRND